MSPKKRGLGQGLGALIPGQSEMAEGQSREGEGLRHVPATSILPNPYQPRSRMEETRLDELAASIREHGIIQPLIVTQLEDGAVGERYQLIAGERRWRAARRAGLEQIPVVVREASDRQILEMALIENIQRDDLNPIEEAMAYQQMAEFSALSQEQIAERVGKSRSAVANTLSLLKLPEPIQEMVRDQRLSEGHARPLRSLPGATAMMDVAELVIERELNVRQTEELVRRYHQGAPKSPREVAQMSVHDRELQRRFASTLGARVELRRRKKGGHLVIHFQNDEDLQHLYERLLGEEGGR